MLPLSYVLMAEMLDCAIRNNPLIDGFLFSGNHCAKLCQHADDTSIIVMSDVALVEVLSLF